MSRAKGFEAETSGAEWLAAHGFEIVERNYQKKCGEIDIIARKNGVIHFVEVKSGENFDPIYAFTPRKISRVIKTAQSWLGRTDTPFCIDALIIRAGGIELIENVTM